MCDSLDRRGEVLGLLAELSADGQLSFGRATNVGEFASVTEDDLLDVFINGGGINLRFSMQTFSCLTDELTSKTRLYDRGVLTSDELQVYAATLLYGILDSGALEPHLEEEFRRISAFLIDERDDSDFEVVQGGQRETRNSAQYVLLRFRAAIGLLKCLLNPCDKKDLLETRVSLSHLFQAAMCGDSMVVLNTDGNPASDLEIRWLVMHGGELMLRLMSGDDRESVSRMTRSTDEWFRDQITHRQLFEGLEREFQDLVTADWGWRQAFQQSLIDLQISVLLDLEDGTRTTIKDQVQLERTQSLIEQVEQMMMNPIGPLSVR